jgi:serine protease Do
MQYPRRILTLAVLLLFAGASFAQPINPANQRNSDKIKDVFREVIARPSDATVRILVDGKSVALGIIVDADGWVLTKWSEVELNRDKITVRLKDGSVHKAEVRGVLDDDKAKPSTAYDLAMLKIDATGLTPIEWANSKEATVGRWVASAGLSDAPVAVGVISVAARKYVFGDQPFKTDLTKVGFLGVTLESAPEAAGARITNINKDSPATKSDPPLKVNDIIYEAAGKRIPDHVTLIELISRYKPNDEVVMRVKRGDDEDLEIKVKLGKRSPKDAGINPQEFMGTTLSKRRGGFPMILQHDSGIRPDVCGGPLVNIDGKVVGMNIARAGRTESYAIPAENITPFLADLKSGKLAPTVRFAADVMPINKTASLTDKDNVDKKRKDMASKRFVKTEEVKLEKDVTYVIEMKAVEAKDGKQLDPFLILEDSQGKELARDDDSGGYPNARITFRAPADGVYRIVCTTYNPSETGSYTLAIRRQADSKEKK